MSSAAPAREPRNASYGPRMKRQGAALAIGLSILLGVLIWLRADGPGWLGDGWRYAVWTIAALLALVASIAVLALAIVSAFQGEPWALFRGRRPDLIAAAAVVAMLALGFLVSGFIAMEQGETEWEQSDRGLFIGGVTHFVTIGCLVVALWWKRAVAVVIAAVPVVSGVLAFRLSPLGGWASEDADFRDNATIADGFMDVFPYTLVCAVLMAAVLALVVLKGRKRAVDVNRTAD